LSTASRSAAIEPGPGDDSVASVFGSRASPSLLRITASYNRPASELRLPQLEVDGR
jgi:hypothetical protein